MTGTTSAPRRFPVARPTASARPLGESGRDADLAEFAAAMQAYKLASGRMFPTWSEVLEVLGSIGYRKPGSSGH